MSFSLSRRCSWPCTDSWPNESGHPLHQYRIGHLIGKAPNRPDKQLLTWRKHAGQQRHKVAEHDIALNEMVVHRLGIAEPKPNPPSLRIRTRLLFRLLFRFSQPLPD